MATVRKLKNKNFLAEVCKNGKRKSKTFPTKIQAMAWATETEQKLSSDSFVQGKTLGDALTRYQNEVSPSKKSYRSEYNRINKLLRSSLSELDLADIQPHHFDDRVKSELERIRPSSVNRDLNLLSALFEQAKRWRWVEQNPIRNVRRPKNPPPRDRRIGDDEIQKILAALGFDGKNVVTKRDSIAVAFLFALETAMRQGEIWGLDWQDIYLDKRYLRLHETKNGTKRDVPLSTEAVRLLKLLNPKRSGRVFNSNQESCAVIFRRSLMIAGIRELTFHDTRHEALTRLARKLEVLDLARMVGHRDPRSLMIYYNATAEEIAGRLG